MRFLHAIPQIILSHRDNKSGLVPSHSAHPWDSPSAICRLLQDFSVYQLLCSLLCRHTAMTLLTAYLGHTAHCTSCSGCFNSTIFTFPEEVFCIASRLDHVVTKKKQHLCQDSRSLPSLWRQTRRHSLLLHPALFPSLAKKHCEALLV